MDGEGHAPKKRIYMDSNATTPIDSVVIDTIVNSLHEQWGNASSSHCYGKISKNAISIARCQVANMIDADPNEVIFTSGGTEANHTVLNIFGANDISRLPCASHIITSTIEHDSIKLPLENMIRNQRIEVTFISVNPKTATVDVAEVVNAIRPNTVLVSIMLANNETGMIQPVKGISEALKTYRKSEGRTIYLHTDTAQAIGKVPVSVKDLDVDYLTIAGHKFYGPRIGALYVKNLGTSCNEAPFQPIFIGGGQERGYRAGTENTAMIAGLGKACELVSNNLSTYHSAMAEVRNELEHLLEEKFGTSVAINFKHANRLPNTSSVSFIGDRFRGKDVLQNCAHVIAGIGAACHSEDGSYYGSAVLRASGISVVNARNALRLSVGRSTTVEDVRIAVDDLANALMKLSAN